jgi:hypothetical protein
MNLINVGTDGAARAERTVWNQDEHSGRKWMKRRMRGAGFHQ